MAAEVFAAITSLRSALEVTKAMIGLRDAEAFRLKSIELQGIILDALEKGIEARESYAGQIDKVRELEAEVERLKEWGSEKERYTLSSVGAGAMVYMLKSDQRGNGPAYWLCPNCFAQGKKSFFQGTGKMEGRRWTYKCIGCGAVIAAETDPKKWPE